VSPGNLNLSYPSGLTTTFSWDPGTDAETPSSGLTYNLRIGTTQTGNEIMSSMSQWNANPMMPSPRWVGGMGNVELNREWSVTLPPVPYITWSVQSVDAGGVASEFASLEQVILGPWIYSVEDVPDDQGGQVEVRFGASHLDWNGETSYPVVDYKVWRQVSPGNWSLVATIPATQIPEYAATVSTGADSSDLGLPMAIFYVSAQTTSPSVTISSPPDSGYSVDNQAPLMPQGFGAGITPAGVSLGWEPSPDEDFRTFRIYRGPIGGGAVSLAPQSVVLVHETTGTSWIDPTGDLEQHYYELAAVDQAGNESSRATTAGQSGVEAGATVFINRLYPASPNPFRRSTDVHFTLDGRRHVSLEIFDLSGRLVRTLQYAELPEGRHLITWDGRNSAGENVASGIYFARMTSGSFRDIERIVLNR
jgi:hypothetical protein